MLYYNDFRNCNDAQYFELNGELNKLKAVILDKYSSKFTSNDRSDYGLTIGFSLIVDSIFQNDFGIVFEDLPNQLSFKVVVFKAFDKGKYRYSKREIVFSGLTIQYIVDHLDEIISACLNKYQSWSKKDVMDSEKTKLGYQGPY